MTFQLSSPNGWLFQSHISGNFLHLPPIMWQRPTKRTWSGTNSCVVEALGLAVPSSIKLLFHLLMFRLDRYTPTLIQVRVSINPGPPCSNLAAHAERTSALARITLAMKRRRLTRHRTPCGVTRGTRDFKSFNVLRNGDSAWLLGAFDFIVLPTSCWVARDGGGHTSDKVTHA